MTTPLNLRLPAKLGGTGRLVKGGLLAASVWDLINVGKLLSLKTF
jgi:hypothetical protein